MPKLDSRVRRVVLRKLLFAQGLIPASLRRKWLASLLKTKSLYCGKRIVLHTSHLLPSRSAISISRGAQIGDEVLLDVTGEITIGKDVTISERASVYTHDHTTIDPTIHWRYQGIEASDITIGDDAWIGAGAILLAGVRKVGRGAVIGAGAVVTKPVADMAIVVGNPARQIRVRGQEASSATP